MPSPGDDGHRQSHLRHDGEIHISRAQRRHSETARGRLLPGRRTRPDRSCQFHLDQPARGVRAVVCVHAALLFTVRKRKELQIRCSPGTDDLIKQTAIHYRRKQECKQGIIQTLGPIKIRGVSEETRKTSSLSACV